MRGAVAESNRGVQVQSSRNRTADQETPASNHRNAVRRQSAFSRTFES